MCFCSSRKHVNARRVEQVRLMQRWGLNPHRGHFPLASTRLSSIAFHSFSIPTGSLRQSGQKVLCPHFNEKRATMEDIELRVHLLLALQLFPRMKHESPRRRRVHTLPSLLDFFFFFKDGALMAPLMTPLVTSLPDQSVAEQALLKKNPGTRKSK